MLDEIGIDLHSHHGKSFDDVDPSSFDLIVTLSPEAHHSALEFTRSAATDVEYWPIPDPSAVEGSRETRLDAYRRTRDLILARLKARFGVRRGRRSEARVSSASRAPAAGRNRSAATAGRTPG